LAPTSTPHRRTIKRPPVRDPRVIGPSIPQAARLRSTSAIRAPSVHFRSLPVFGPSRLRDRLPSRARGLLAGLSSRFQTGFEPELVFLGFRQELVSRASDMSSFPGLPTRAQCPANICGEVLQHLGVCFLECMWALGPSCHCSHVRLVQGCARCPFVLPTCHFATAPHSRACHAPMGECGVVCGSAPMPAPRAPPFGPSLATKLRFAQPGAQASLLGRERKAPMQV
jgi:hypothetical protein